MADPGRWLEGLVVIDLTRYLAGPACTRLLVELGADVLKIEMPPYGDPNRSNRPRIDHRSGAHVQQNRGKQSVCLDIDAEAGRDILRRLVEQADVLVENFSPGVLDRKGLGYADLAPINPRLIMASVSGFGQSGLLSDRPCFDLIAQGYAGIMHMTGDPDGEPTFVGTGLADSNAGAHAFGAIGHALFHRERTGEGAHLDVAMVDSLFHFHEQAVHAPSMDPTFVPGRQGRNYQTISPAGTFRGPRGWIVILCTQWQMPNLWRAMGRPELAEDGRFATNPARIENRAALTDLIETWMASFDSDDDVMDVLAEHRVPHGPCLSPDDARRHQHFLERGLIRTIHDPRIGTLQVPGFPFRVNGASPSNDLVAPALGEHNAEVLKDRLGLDDRTIARLESQGVLGSKPH